MKKDKEWLKNEISEIYEKWLPINGDKVINLNWLNLLIDQLDEPQKPVVPKWFDEWAKQKVSPATDGLDLAYFMVEEYTKSRFTQNQDLYIKKHWRNILLAFANGYEGEEKEKENLYWVRDKNGKSLIFRSRIDDKSSSSCENGVIVQQREPQRYQFTEQEIKDYDERYVPFMVPVEEVDNE